VYWVDKTALDHLRFESGPDATWIIDGAVANQRRSFFSALATAVRFPVYFGHNWDATYDCLTDLAGGDKQPAVLFITHGDLFLAGMGAEWAVGHRVFTDAAAFWKGQGRLLQILLLSDTALPGVLALPATCLRTETLVESEDEIDQADDRIRALNRSGQFADALLAARELVSRFPDNARAHFVLGGTFDFQDREAEAVPPYQRAWELGLRGDDVPRFYVQYGSTLRNIGEFDESVRVLQEGRERFPEDCAIQAFLALALFSAGDTAAALATALTLLLENAEAVNMSGYDRALREYVAELR
jgi:tetratricopeptide (TPR) repeat protein